MRRNDPGSASDHPPPTAIQLAECFNSCFADTHQVRLVGGGNEPSYLPAQQPSLANTNAWRGALLTHSYDYPASALHEVAHWCIAGAARRQLEDFGYAYVPPPRSTSQQRQFFRVESRVQALESVFARATGVRFVISADNLSATDADVNEFAAEVAAIHGRMFAQWLQCEATSRRPLPVRAQQYLGALQDQKLVVPNWPLTTALNVNYDRQPTDRATAQGL